MEETQEKKQKNTKKVETLRYGNHVPLNFDQGSCAITEAIKSIDWKHYHLNLETMPITILVNINSTQIPYLSTGKQSISPEPEIIHEIRQGTMKLARALEKHLNHKKSEKEKIERSKIFEKLIPTILKESGKLGETEVPEYREILSKITKRSIEEIEGKTILKEKRKLNPIYEEIS